MTTQTILERFESGEYNTPNGARLFLLDMKELEETIDVLENNIVDLEYEMDKLQTIVNCYDD